MFTQNFSRARDSDNEDDADDDDDDADDVREKWR